MKKKAVLLVFVLIFLPTALSSYIVGLLELQTVYASPYIDIDVETAYDMITNGSFPDLVVLDVRTKSEYDSGHIYGAVWIPVLELGARIGELAGHEHHEIVVYCKSGGRSATASGILDSNDFTKVYNMLGGITDWQSAGYPVWIATVQNVDTTFNYDTIQAAIDASQTLDGHTILVGAGTYYEHVVVSKSISLIGESRSSTIIDGNWTIGNGINVTANNVAISRFTIKNNGFDQQKETGNGIYVFGSISGISITDNIIFNNTNGVFLRDSPSGSSIIGNVVTINNLEGIYLDGASDNLIKENLVTNSTHGILLEGSSINTIAENNVADNQYGIYINSSSTDNVVYRNNFINNTSQSFLESSTSSAEWDNGYEGNHWSDYTGLDDGSDGRIPGDGIGDTDLPHQGVDYYPLITPYILGDGSRDGYVNLDDLELMSYAWLSENGYPNFLASVDFNIDGMINLDDLEILSAHWLQEAW